MTAISRIEAAELSDELRPELGGMWHVTIPGSDIDEMELTPAQVDGLACILCGDSPLQMNPVGHTECKAVDGQAGPDDERQLFACYPGCGR